MEEAFNLHTQWAPKSGKGWINASWHEARLPLPVTESVLISACLCFKLVIQFLCAGERRDTLFYRLRSIHFRPTKYGFKNSILTFSDWLLSCHKSDYLHPRWARHASVKGIQFSTAAAGGGGGDAKKSSNGWGEGGGGGHNKAARGRMKFISEGAPTSVVEILPPCFQRLYTNHRHPQGFPSEKSLQTWENKICRPQFVCFVLVAGAAMCISEVSEGSVGLQCSETWRWWF